MGLASDKVRLSNYSEQWNELFHKEKVELEYLLGNQVPIIHVGSTSIPQMQVAKPVIDIAVGVSDMQQMIEIKKILLDKGYFHNPSAGSDDRLFFAKGNQENRLFNIHVEIIGGTSWSNHVDFKRIMSENPEYIVRYCELKKKLAAAFPNDRKKYTQGKAAFIQEVLELKHI